MEARAGRAAGEADGVMVVSVWTTGEAGELLARVTMTARSSEPGESEVLAVSTPGELHAVLDSWLARVRGDRPG